MMAGEGCNPMDRLVTTVKTRAPGITDDMLNLELFNTINEFFRRTNTWTYREEVGLLLGEYRYNIFPPADAAMVRVMAVTYNDSPMMPVSAGGTTSTQRGRLTPDTTWVDGDAAYLPDEMSPPSSSGTPFRYAMYFPQYIAFDVAPDAQAVQHPVVMYLALTLAQKCMDCDCGDWGLEEWMYDMFFEDWLDGCLGRLMSMIAKPWSNPTMAAYHGKRFRQHMAFRRQEQRRGYVNDVQPFRFPIGGFLLR